MLQSVAGAGHVNNLAAVDEAVEDSGGNGSVAKEVGPLVKPPLLEVMISDVLSLMAEIKPKNRLASAGERGHEAHLVHHHEGGLVGDTSEAALAGTGDLGGL